jgi:hypothetical protein
MAVKKVKFCDNPKCKKMIDSEKESFIWFPFYGWNGRIFCGKSCLHQWAENVSSYLGHAPEIQIN